MREVTEALSSAGFAVDGVVTSSITGPEGNVEYLVRATFAGSATEPARGECAGDA